MCISILYVCTLFRARVDFRTKDMPCMPSAAEALADDSKVSKFANLHPGGAKVLEDGVPSVVRGGKLQSGAAPCQYSSRSYSSHDCCFVYHEDER